MTINRAETGVVQFENDHPGIFLRGDDALAWAITLRRVLGLFDKPPMKLRAMEELLRSCDCRLDPQVQLVRLISPEQAAGDEP